MTCWYLVRNIISLDLLLRVKQSAQMLSCNHSFACCAEKNVMIVVSPFSVAVWNCVHASKC